MMRLSPKVVSLLAALSLACAPNPEPTFAPYAAAPTEDLAEATTGQALEGLAQPPQGATEEEWTSAWIDGPVSTIITIPEANDYAQLESQERADFIADFWTRRDPDPSTPGNEYLPEFSDDIRVADRAFGTQSTPGWRTVFGHVVLVLGVPESVERVEPRESPTRGSPEIVAGKNGAKNGVSVRFHYPESSLVPMVRVRSDGTFGPNVDAGRYVVFTYWDGIWRAGCAPAADEQRLGAVEEINRGGGTYSRGRTWSDVRGCPEISDALAEVLDAARLSLLTARS